MTVQPMVTLGGDGTFLLAEPMEGQGQRPTATTGVCGALRVAGETGRGEFRLPLTGPPNTRWRHRGGRPAACPADLFSGLRGGSGNRNVSDHYGAGSPGSGRRSVSAHRDAAVRGGTDASAHLGTAARGTSSAVFLPMGVPEESLGYALTFQGTFAALEADTIWAGWALSDTLYKFSRQGDRLTEIPLPMVRPMGTLPRAGETVPDADAGADPFDRFTQVVRVSVLDDGNLVVTSMQSRGTDAVWDLLIIDRTGQQLLGAPNMPQLLAVEQGLFYTSMIPRRCCRIGGLWRVGRVVSSHEVVSRTPPPHLLDCIRPAPGCSHAPSCLDGCRMFAAARQCPRCRRRHAGS